MLCDLYSTIDVYREADRTDDWGNTSKRSNFVLNGTIQGYIQPRAGSFANTNQSNIPLFTSVLYADPGVDVLVNDRVVQDGNSYQVVFIQPRGIGAIEDHAEIGLSYINDKDLP